MRNLSGGNVVARLSGQDDPNQNNTLHQEVQCCYQFWKTANHQMDYSLNQDLRVRFYSWSVRQGSCAGARGSGSDPRMCNSNGEEIRDDLGQNMHCGFPPFEEPVPFPPRHDAFRDFNVLGVAPGETRYFVPNLFDMFMSEPRDGGTARWIARNLARTCQSDWYLGSMLREYEPDLLGGVLGSL